MEALKNVFDQCGIIYETVDLGDGWTILVSQHGGHVYGPFSEQYPEGIFWAPEDTKDAEKFKKLVEQRVWNTGGDRVWISPEIQFNITDRAHYRETLKQPAIMDPGYHTIRKKKNQVTVQQLLTLRSYNTVQGEMYFDFKRTINPAPNPLGKLKTAEELMQGISYCGFEQVLDLKVESDQDIFAESWDLLQIRPKGTLYIPMYDVIEATDHYEPVEEYQYRAGSGVCLKITGDRRYKVGFKSAVLTGRFGYLADSDTDESYLLILNYPNNPSSMYAEEPPEIPGDTGYSIHVYNDNGSSGGFAEMECNLQTIGRPTGLDHAIDRVTKWIFTGKTAQLKKIAKVLLGYDYE